MRPGEELLLGSMEITIEKLLLAGIDGNRRGVACAGMRDYHWKASFGRD